jgi:hypothetical protein
MVDPGRRYHSMALMNIGSTVLLPGLLLKAVATPQMEVWP